MSKRSVWRQQDITAVLQEVIEKHDLYLAKKRVRKLGEFWAEVGGKVGQSGDATEKLIRNLGAEFQRNKQQMAISGCATDEHAVLRGSADIYAGYEDYYHLYFPQGGSTVPKVVLTTKNSHLRASSGDLQPADELTMAPDDDVARPGPSTSDVTPTEPVVVSRKKGKAARRPVRPTSFFPSSLRLQREANSLKRQRLQVERKRNHILEGISAELTLLRSAYCAVHGVSVAPVENEM